MADMIRAYDAERDLDAVARIWREVGWIDDSDSNLAALKTFMSGANAEVAELNGSAECMVHWSPGSMHYQNTALPLCVVTGVTTSLVGRKHGFASAMTARALDQGANAGCAVAALGMFEQGFYDRFGFGTGTYDHRFTFDPAALKVDHVPYRPPVRLGIDDSADVHEALGNRNKTHGSIVLDFPENTQAELGWADDVRCLGYVVWAIATTTGVSRISYSVRSRARTGLSRSTRSLTKTATNSWNFCACCANLATRSAGSRSPNLLNSSFRCCCQSRCAR